MAFPYRQDEATQLTKATFEALSDEEAFNLCCQGIINDTADEEDGNWDVNSMPYELTYRRASKYGKCNYCNQFQCSGCRVKFDAETTVLDCLRLQNHETNDTLFSE